MIVETIIIGDPMRVPLIVASVLGLFSAYFEMRTIKGKEVKLMEKIATYSLSWYCASIFAVGAALFLTTTLIQLYKLEQPEMAHGISVASMVVRQLFLILVLPATLWVIIVLNLDRIQRRREERRD